MPTIYSRVHNKKDTSVNWDDLNPVLLDGEIILVACEDGEIRLKVGDGVTPYKELPFTDSAVRELLNGKLSTQQSAEDADKVLGIGSDGTVTPVRAVKYGDALTWGDLMGTTV